MRALKADAEARVSATASGKRKAAKPPRKTRDIAHMKRMRRWRLGGALFLLLGLAALAVYGQSHNWHGKALLAADKALDDGWRAIGLQVGEVTIEGRNRTGVAALRRTLDVQIGDPILRVDLDRMQQQIAQIGWVSEVVVTRQLPDRLHIRIVEREPFARWQVQGRTALIDRDGNVILSDVRTRFARLPRLVGPEANTRAAALFESLQAAPELLQQVKTASLIRQRRWDLGLANGTIVHLPEVDTEGAWLRFSEMEQRDQLLKRDYQQIDLRVPGRVIVGMPPPPPPVEVERET